MFAEKRFFAGGPVFIRRNFFSNHNHGVGICSFFFKTRQDGDSFTRARKHGWGARRHEADGMVRRTHWFDGVVVVIKR